MAGESLHELHGPLGPEAYFRRLTGEDKLGRPFNFNVEVLSTKADLSPYDMVGKTMAVELKSKSGDSRFFHGIISRFLNVGNAGGLQLYQLELRPWIWLLSHSLDSRIFQELTIPEIIGKVFKDKNGFSDYKLKLQGTYEKQTYCVQYRESDFDFVTRLMEQEGIYYYFEHEKGKHTVVLADAPTSHKAIEGDGQLYFRPPDLSAGEEQVTKWQHHVAVQPGKLVLRDFDYNKPSANLEVRLVSKRNHPNDSVEQYDYPGSYSETSDGNRYLKLRKEEFDAKFSYVEGQARSHRLFTGGQFTLKEHPRDDNAEFTVIASNIDIVSGEIERFTSLSENRSDIQFIAIKKDSPFRLPRETPSPVISGPQTAIVVGKNGEEIWTDSLGRIKVQFPWDREGKNDESSSCWIRVSQTWSGKGWGAMHIPRIGQEVIVEFLEGDPNRPLVTGRVYNTEQTVPYALPGSATQSGILSRSTPEGDQNTFNELRFEDKKGEEAVYFHAEKDFNRVVENNDTLKVGFEKKDNGDQTIEIFGNQTVTVGCGDSDGSQTLTVYKDQTETIQTGDRTIEISKGSDTLTISAGDQKIDISKGQCEITAAKKIVLKVGGSSIEITPNSIVLKATQITVDAQMKAEVKATTTDISGSALVKVQGGIIKLN
ncbi:MAG: type VI secretion system tip protein TssI/VgrG [Pirellulaceae bacterium]|nr:type VI secretion system tip protein TssI/VgrG [Pirellulaceae bacterium]